MDSHMIISRCPSCGGCFLFIGKGGHLTCSLIGCKEPVVDRAVDNIKAKVERLQKEYNEIHDRMCNAECAANTQSDQVERLKAENYNDLLDQMDAKGWGNFHEINTEEVYAFINSRATHKPTTKLRTENKRLREALGEIRVEASARKETAIIWRIDEALKEGE